MPTYWINPCSNLSSDWHGLSLRTQASHQGAKLPSIHSLAEASISNQLIWVKEGFVTLWVAWSAAAKMCNGQAQQGELIYQGRGWYFALSGYILERRESCWISPLVCSNQHWGHELLMSNGTNKSRNHLSRSFSNQLKIKTVIYEKHMICLFQFYYDFIWMFVGKLFQTHLCSVLEKECKLNRLDKLWVDGLFWVLSVNCILHLD